MGIPLKVDSPGVGKNLQSHVGTGDVIFTLRDPVSFNALRLYLNPLNLISYLANGKGPLSGVSGFDGMGNIRVNQRHNSSKLYNENGNPTDAIIGDPNWPDIQISMLAIHVGMVFTQ